VCDHVRDWVNGTAPGTWVSMGVVSPGGEGAYGIDAGLMYSFPVTCEGGKWAIVPGLAIDGRGGFTCSQSVTSLTPISPV
jgi:malate dehydrogenase